MANELKHGTVGTELTQAEWEAVGAHVVANQAVGDIIFADTTTQLLRLGIGATNDVLRVTGGKPDWQATSYITSLGTIATGVWQGTDVGVAYGGTGVSTLTDGGVLLGSGASAITAMAVLTDGQMIVGDGTGDPVAESGATLRTSIGVGTGDTLSLTGLTLSTDLTVANGGTGVSTLTANGVLIGNGASAVAVTATMATKGHLMIGDGSGVPSMLGVGTNDHVMTADSGEATGVKWAAPAAAAAGSVTGATLASGVTASSLTSVGTLTALTGVTGDLDWDSGTLFVDSSESQLGVGTTSPAYTLSVVGNAELRTTSGAVGGDLRQEFISTGATGGFGSIRKTIRGQNLDDVTATTVFSITNTNEAGNVDAGTYICHMRAMVSHGGQNNAAGGGPTTRYWEGFFSKSVDYGASHNTSSVVESFGIDNSQAVEGKSSVNGSQRSMADEGVTVTVDSTTAYNTDVKFSVDLTGTEIDTAEIVVVAEVIWEKFRTPPAISGV